VGEQHSNISVRDLTQGNISRELFSLALPLLAISFIQMAYNLVDILWIGRLGSEAVAAVGSVGMLMWMMNSFALISKVSAEITIGQSIGARRLDKASIYASHTTTIAIILGITFGLIFSCFQNPTYLFISSKATLHFRQKVISDSFHLDCLSSSSVLISQVYISVRVEVIFRSILIR